jgi:hypothetical protein
MSPIVGLASGFPLFWGRPHAEQSEMDATVTIPWVGGRERTNVRVPPIAGISPSVVP